MVTPVMEPEGHEAEPVLLFRGSPDSARELASFLEGRGIASEVTFLETRGPRGLGQGYVAGVVVSPEAFEHAREALAEWSAPQAERAQSLARRVRRIFLLSLLPPLAWLGLSRWLPDVFRAPGLDALAFTWFFSVFVIGRLEHRRYTRERIEMPEIH